MIVKNDLYDYPDRYIYQDSEYFKFSVDSILLAEYVKKYMKHARILDMCAGNMVIPLILSKYGNNDIVGFEIQKKVYNLGLKSILLNNLHNNIKIINDDINNLSKYYPSDYFDIMLCNPPFFRINSNKKMINNKEELSVARHEVKIVLEDVYRLAKTHLKNKGCLYLVQRADRLDEMIFLGYKYKILVKEVQLISTKKSGKPHIVLLKAVKNGKPGININAEICIEGVKTYQNIFEES